MSTLFSVTLKIQSSNKKGYVLQSFKSFVVSSDHALREARNQALKSKAGKVVGLHAMEALESF